MCVKAIHINNIIRVLVLISAVLLLSLALVLVDGLLQRLLDRLTLLLVEGVALPLGLVLHLGLLHVPALSLGRRGAVLIMLRLVMGGRSRLAQPPPVRC